MELRRLSIFLLFILLTNTVSLHAQPKNGEDVIRAMYSKYHDSWYKNITFVQNTIFYGRNGNVEREQLWYEAISLPGKLAIKFDELDSPNGILFADGVQYGFANGTLMQQVDRVHDLLVLGFNVYHQEPKITISQLTENGYDFSQMYEDNWNDRPVYVIGVSKPDSTIPQIWIDKERLIFVRNLTIGRADTIQEIQFNNYERIAGGWIAPTVLFMANGTIGLKEEYSQITIPDTLDARIFVPETFIDSSW